MKTSIIFKQPLFTGSTEEIANNHRFTNPYKYGYQNQEKSDVSNPWYQFELRNYNQDLGRWFAPDPYGQFASPYIAMGNNPVSGVDPDGGWVNAAPNEGRKFAGKDRMDWERENNTGAFSAEATQARYEDRYENLVKQYMGFENGNRNDVGGFMNAIGALNSEYYGLCKNSGVNFSAQNGQQYLSQNEINLNENSVLAAQGSIQTTDFQKGERAKMASDANSAWNALKSWSSTRREIIRNFGINLSDGKRIISKGKEDSRKSAKPNDNEKKSKTKNGKTQTGDAGHGPNSDGIADRGMYDGLKQFIAISVSEAGANSKDPFKESQAIGEVLLNRLKAVGRDLDQNFIDNIGGAGQFDVMDGKNARYNSIMNSTWDDVLSPDNSLRTNIQGAIHAFMSPEDNISGGAYFWTASGNKWSSNLVKQGTFTQTSSYGGSQFFKYTDSKKSWP